MRLSALSEGRGKGEKTGRYERDGLRLKSIRRRRRKLKNGLHPIERAGWEALCPDNEKINEREKRPLAHASAKSGDEIRL